MIEFEGYKKLDTNLNITPLIDVVFQLLLFFALTLQFGAVSGIKLTLPDSTTSQIQNEQDIVISLSEENTLYLDKERVSMDELANKLKTRLALLKKKAVVIRADEKVDMGLVVKIMDIARHSGSKELTISTKEQYGQ